MKANLIKELFHKTFNEAATYKQFNLNYQSWVLSLFLSLKTEELLHQKLVSHFEAIG